MINTNAQFHDMKRLKTNMSPKICPTGLRNQNITLLRTIGILPCSLHYSDKRSALTCRFHSGWRLFTVSLHVLYTMIIELCAQHTMLLRMMGTTLHTIEKAEYS